MESMRRLFVFNYWKSKGGASVFLEAADAASQVRALQLDDDIVVLSCCRFSGKEQTERVLVFDDITKSVLELKLS